MEEAAADPLDISKEQELIKDAQKDLSKLDVLVCGGCHEVFHFVEEFQKHKTSEQCTNVSVLKCENEEKPQIWGFTLWKTKQINTCKSRGEEPPSSWEIYQNWTKLDQIEKDLWISAGKTLQFFNNVSKGKVASRVEKKEEKDPLALEDGEDEVRGQDLEQLIKAGIVTKGPKTGIRTVKDTEAKEEFNVERIVGKRFSPRKRTWEYQVKWENYSELTWEPVTHLENCKALVDEFEAKLKAEKEKTPSRGRGRPRIHPQSPGSVKIVPKKPATPPTNAVVITTPGGRPQRTSKQKALNQVKAWCGNISDEEGGVKRPFDDDADSDDSFEKKIRLEGESEDTEEDEPKAPVRKVAKIVSYNNGAGRKLPDNVLIPDAKGVVRISQKQLPSLSSGVYIMSKSSGIIKLDPTASKIATSGGQAIVKVSPKIGQTQIKIIKRDDGSKRVVQVKAPEQQQTPTPVIAPKPRILSQVIAKPPIVVKKDVIQTPVKKIETPVKATPPKPAPIKAAPIKTVDKKDDRVFPISNDDDSDDGIPELEFPTDLPLPEPDSPPGEFILDPTTGKVAGMEYPEPEPVKEQKKDANESIDNIVKLAAADITEDDLKPDNEVTTTSARVENGTTTPSVTSTPPTIVTTPILAMVPSTPNKDNNTVYAVVTDVKNQSIFLNTPLANSTILQKTLQAASRPKTQPRIINQSVAKPRPNISQVIRPPVNKTTIRPKPPPSLPKPRFNISPMTPTAIKNTYSPKSNNITKRIGNTTVYKTKPSPAPVRKSPQKVGPPPAAPKPIISMPSLDEEPAPAVLAAQPAPKSDAATVEADLSTFTLAAPDRPMFITGDDGTVYQVAGQNEEGQTILVTQDSDGQQQCLLVTSEAISEEVEQVAANPSEMLMEVQEPVEVATEEQPLVAQFIRTEPPSPGGTHKVVVMLPDGDVMVTQVTPEEYASLELDK